MPKSGGASTIGTVCTGETRARQQTLASAQYQSGMSAPPIHRPEAGVEPQPGRQNPDPDYLVGVDRLRRLRQDGTCQTI